MSIFGGMFEKYPLESFSVFENMPSLTCLRIGKIKPVDRSIGFLKTLPNLKEFDFDAGMFTTEEIAYMCARYPHIHGTALYAYNKEPIVSTEERVGLVL